MSRAEGYSLWLVPSGEAHTRLQDVVSQLSERYHTPSFEPHITLLGEVVGSESELASKTRELISAVQKFRVELDSVDCREEYFKCLFLNVRENDALRKANNTSKRIFGRHTDQTYMPHLSLLYGNFSPATKEEMIREIGNQWSVCFAVESIHLFSANGGPEEWYRLAEFHLQ